MAYFGKGWFKISVNLNLKWKTVIHMDSVVAWFPLITFIYRHKVVRNHLKILFHQHSKSNMFLPSIDALAMMSVVSCFRVGTEEQTVITYGDLLCSPIWTKRFIHTASLNLYKTSCSDTVLVGSLMIMHMLQAKPLPVFVPEYLCRVNSLER